MTFKPLISAIILFSGPALADGHSTDDVHWHVTMTVNAGQMDAVEPLLNRMVAATQANEPGAIVYDYMGEGNEVHIYERYADSAAAVTHMGNFAENFAEEFLQTFTVTSVDVYGPVGDDLKEILDPFSPTYMHRISGFAR